ncbi:hypothetical protein RSOLAG1IB_08703 [Rhizoctonia solani AG-1 IB]|uniref:Ricin B lectin domain-containing protein n=1 Tax=Thanatephorus cucumeris (strain AG1-IB / isolate 7/3/14) TaxID=1108050 RepID=A0A0B7FLU5_THACB|nr:hypothetical protein RSOLAG1IB_08703 [Rhizoctonia solani AG-1 IB]
MSLQSGLYELQSTTNQLWAGLGTIQLSDPPPPTPLKGLEYEMKGEFEIAHQCDNSYHILIPGMNKSELRSEADVVKLMPFAPRQSWTIEPTYETSNYLIRDQDSVNYWTLVDDSDPWGTPIRLQGKRSDLHSQKWRFVASQRG